MKYMLPCRLTSLFFGFLTYTSAAHGYAVGPAPARVNLTIGGNRHAHLHLARPPHAGRGQRPALVVSPDIGRDQPLQHAP